MLVTIQNCSFLLANGAPVPALMRFSSPPSGLRGFVLVVRDRWEQGRFGGPGARGLGAGRGGDTMGGGGGGGGSPGPESINACMHAYIHTYIPTYVRTYIHTLTRAHTHTLLCTCIHIYIDTDLYVVPFDKDCDTTLCHVDTAST